MAKIGKLTKLKSVLKKLNSFTTKNRHHHSTMASASSSFSSGGGDHTLYPVYVGKSLRRYLVSSDVICNPVFRELVHQSPPSDDSDSIITVGCEVVLFEHLLWMLENGDHHEEEVESHADSLDELVQYYTY